MSTKTSAGRTITNLIWRFAERCGAQGVTLVVSIILARLLDPTVYGTIAMVTVITTILQVFVDSGLGSALIQKKDADDLDFSTVFYFNITMCSILYLILFCGAPLIAKFYGVDELTPLVRVISLTIVISGVKNIQQSYVSKHLQFKRFFFATIGGTIGAAAVGIGMAYAGFGVWALVAQSLFNSLVGCVILWVTVKWRPKLMFSFVRLKGLFSYGWKLLVSSLLDTVYNNIRQLIIGKMYTSSDLAFYNKAHQFPQIVVTNVNASIDSVLLPVMSEQQDNKKRVKEMTRRAIKVSTYIMAPLMMGLLSVAPEFVSVLLTDKWLPCVPYLRIFCITFMFYPIHTANLNAIKAVGRSDIFLKLEIIKKIIGVTLLLSTMWFGVMAMAYSLLVGCLTSQVINSWPNKKLLGYSYFEQVKDILPSLILAAVMGAAVMLMPLLNLSSLVTLVLQIVLGAMIYILGSAAFKFDSFVYLINVIKKFISKRKKAV